MKKNVFLLLAVAAVLGALCGCMSDEVEAGRGPERRLITISY